MRRSLRPYLWPPRDCFDSTRPTTRPPGASVRVAPDRAHGVHHMAGRQIAAGSDHRLSGRELPFTGHDLLALGEDGRPPGAMNCASTPPPPISDELAAFTITSASTVVMSPWMASRRVTKRL